MGVAIEIERERALLRVLVRPEDAGLARGAAAIVRLCEAVERLGRDADLYAMVVHGARHLTPARLGAVATTPDSGAAVARVAATRLAWQIDCCPKPVVSIIDGPATGLLAGLAAHTTHRVAGPDFTLAPVDASLDHLPLCGVSHLLARLPEGVGPYLATTGAALGVHEALSLGLLTHALSAEQVGEVEALLVDAEPIDPLLDARHNAGMAPMRPLPSAAVLACFARETHAEIQAELARLDERHRAVGRQLARELEGASSARIDKALALLRNARVRDLREAMLLELAVAEGAAPEHAAIIDTLGLPTRAALQLYRN